MKRIKLLIFVKAIDGGTGTYVIALQKIKKLFHQKSLDITTVVLERPKYRNIKNLKSFIYYRDVGYYPFKYSLTLKGIRSMVEELIWFRNIVKKNTPDIILGVDVYCNLIIGINTCIFRLKNIKTIFTTHIYLDENISKRAGPVLRFLLKKCIHFFYNKVDSLVFVSKELEKNSIRVFGLNKKISSTIYNGVKVKNLSYTKKKENGKKIIISVLRLVDQKDHKTLIDAFGLLQKRLPGAELWIMSNGDKKKELEEQVKKLKISRKVRFYGWVKDIDKYLKRADIFVFSSKREGFGISLVEAMSHGLPVISTKTPLGPSEILGGGRYGLMVPMFDKYAMSKGMHRLLSNRTMRNRYARLAVTRSRFFSIDKMERAYKDLITSLLRKEG